jgi:hypothetical protein
VALRESGILQEGDAVVAGVPFSDYDEHEAVYFFSDYDVYVVLGFV